MEKNLINHKGLCQHNESDGLSLLAFSFIKGQKKSISLWIHLQDADVTRWTGGNLVAACSITCTQKMSFWLQASLAFYHQVHFSKTLCFGLLWNGCLCNNRKLLWM